MLSGEWQSSEVGVTVSARQGRRAKAVDSFAIGAGRFSPDVRFKEPTRQCKEGGGRKGVHFDSHVKNFRELTPINIENTFT